MCRNGLRKAKAILKQDLARDKYPGQKRMAKESVPPLIYKKGELVTTDMQLAEVINEFFASVFTCSQASHFYQIPDPLSGPSGEGSPSHYKQRAGSGSLHKAT